MFEQKIAAIDQELEAWQSVIKTDFEEAKLPKTPIIAKEVKKLGLPSLVGGDHLVPGHHSSSGAGLLGGVHNLNDITAGNTSSSATALTTREERLPDDHPVVVCNDVELNSTLMQLLLQRTHSESVRIHQCQRARLEEIQKKSGLSEYLT